MKPIFNFQVHTHQLEICASQDFSGTFVRSGQQLPKVSPGIAPSFGFLTCHVPWKSKKIGSTSVIFIIPGIDLGKVWKTTILHQLGSMPQLSTPPNYHKLFVAGGPTTSCPDSEGTLLHLQDGTGTLCVNLQYIWGAGSRLVEITSALGMGMGFQHAHRKRHHKST